MRQQAMKPKDVRPHSRIRVSVGLVAMLGLLVMPFVVVTDSASANGACSGEVQPAGSGTIIDPYRVATASNLIWISLKRASPDNSLQKHYLQTADIDLGGCTFSPIGDNSEAFGINSPATYNGGGFVIRGLKIVGGVSGNTGLFGQSLGIIRNVGIENALVSSGSYYVGALVGYNRGSVVNSYSSGQVSGTPSDSRYIGGLVGLNTDVVENSYSTASVSGLEYVGGLVGLQCTNDAAIVNSYATGNVVLTPTAPPTAGGLFPSGTYEGIDTCGFPNQGVVGSFWDTQTTGQTGFTIAGQAEGRSTAQMKTLATYTTAPAWDIVQGWVPYSPDPTGGNPARIWGICSEFNSGYPFLLWQASSDPCISATPPTLASTGAEVDLMALGSLTSIVAGAGFFALSRRKRTA
jgi:hypothetical protein